MSAETFRRVVSRRWATLITCALVACSAATGAHAANCVDDGAERPTPDLAIDGGTPRGNEPQSLQSLLAEALRRSRAVGAARFLADAAQSDLQETQAGKLPQASLVNSLSHVGYGSTLQPTAAGLQARSSLNLSAPLYDAGQLDALIDWRRQLAEASRLGRLSSEEQVSLQTASLAFERSRYGAQRQIYEQYQRKMACLVDSLEEIVRADRGRASELVQARKSAQQVALSLEDTSAQLAQIETRLRYYVGPVLPPLAPLALVRAMTAPPLATALADASNAPDVAQLARQAEAQESLARATLAGQKVQASWAVTGSRAAGTGQTGNNWSWTAGVNLSVPLLDPGAHAAGQAAQQRAMSARLGYEDALEARQSRVIEAEQQVEAAEQRARRIVDVLANSNRVRNDTLLQWQQLGRRSLFDVMAAEGDHYGLRIARINALYDGQQAAALIWSLGRGVAAALQQGSSP